MKNDYLFVYGTLMKRFGHPKHALLEQYAAYLCDAWTLGRLYQVADYPGMVMSNHAEEKVFGELYRILDAQIFAALDDYEACSEAYPQPHEYQRQLIQIHTEHNVISEACCYLYNWPYNESTIITSGRFM